LIGGFTANEIFKIKANESQKQKESYFQFHCNKKKYTSYHSIHRFG